MCMLYVDRTDRLMLFTAVCIYSKCFIQLRIQRHKMRWVFINKGFNKTLAKMKIESDDEKTQWHLEQLRNWLINH
jgi:hypothetical protein